MLGVNGELNTLHLFNITVSLVNVFMAMGSSQGTPCLSLPAFNTKLITLNCLLHCPKPDLDPA